MSFPVAARLVFAVFASTPLLLPATVNAASLKLAEAGGAKIKGGNFEASIEADGCMADLQVGGKPFIQPGVRGFTRGIYLFANGKVIPLDKISLESDSAILAQGSGASIRYLFSDDGITFQTKNDGTGVVSFFMIFHKGVTDLTTADGKSFPLPVGNDLAGATLRSGTSELIIARQAKYWPFETFQVAQVDVAAGGFEEIAVSFKTGDKTETPAAEKPMEKGPVSIESPSEYQVIQRTSEASGPLRIAVSTQNKGADIEYRITGESNAGKLPGQWVKMDTNQTEVDVTAPAGGWSKLEVRTSEGGKPKDSAVVEHFGIGDIFIGAGQSNSTSCGEFRTETQTGNVSNFTGERWRLANDPQLGSVDEGKPGCDGGSFYPAFGDALAKELGVPIGVVPTGCTGTSVEYWKPGGGLFKRLEERMNELGEHGFRAVLWHQGETDVAMDGGKYFDLLKTVITKSREKAGWDVPWIVAQATFPHTPKDNPIRLAQARIWVEDFAYEGPDTDRLGLEYRDKTSVHFNPKGLAAHGKLWAEKVLAAKLPF